MRLSQCFAVFCFPLSSNMATCVVDKEGSETESVIGNENELVSKHLSSICNIPGPSVLEVW
jgi:hypothetical protein